MKLQLMFCVLALACGGPSKGVGEVGPDGALQLIVDEVRFRLSDRSLAGTQIRITRLDEDLVPSASTSVYRFEPTGLEFIGEAEVCFDVDAPHSSGIAWGEFRALESLSVYVDGSYVCARTPHFSIGAATLEEADGGPADTTLDSAPDASMDVGADTASDVGADAGVGDSWIRQFGTPDTIDEVSAIAISYPRAAIAGLVGDEPFLERIDLATGDPEWTTNLELVCELVAANSDFVYCASNDFAEDRVVVSQFDWSGAMVWTRTLSFSAGVSAFGLAASAGGVFVAGGFEISDVVPQTHGYLRRYDTLGAVAWDEQIELSQTRVNSVALDAAGNLFVAGQTQGVFPGEEGTPTIFGDDQAFVRKYDSDDNPVWARQWGSQTRAVAVDVDPLGDVYIAGVNQSSLVGTPFIHKYDASGDEVWTRGFGGIDVDVSGFGLSLTVGPGVAVVTGQTESSLPGYVNAGHTDLFAKAVALESGADSWVWQLGSDWQDSSNSVGGDVAGNLLIGGATRGALPGTTASGDYEDTDAFVLLHPVE